MVRVERTSGVALSTRWCRTHILVDSDSSDEKEEEDNNIPPLKGVKGVDTAYAIKASLLWPYVCVVAFI